jgi:hypothetical protein
VYVYDKAKYHDDSCHKLKLGEDQSFVHTGLFFDWIVLNDLLSPGFGFEEHVIAKTKERVWSPTGIYEWCDGVLVDDMLSDEGNAFAMAYFDFGSGQYLKDYETYLSKELKSVFAVPNTWDSYDRIAPVIDVRYRQFKGEEVELPPVPTAPPRQQPKSLWKKIFG